MKLDAPMVMMVGVAGLGAFALYKMFGSRGNAPQTTSPEAAAIANALPGEKVTLQQNAKFQGRLKLTSTSIPSISATSEQLRTFLQVLGFSNVAVFMSPQELPFNWTAARDGSEKNRWFGATWNGMTVSVPRPEQLDQLAVDGRSIV